VGGGESTLADDLVSRGYQNVTVLDISETAINASKQRMGETASKVHWLVADTADRQNNRHNSALKSESHPAEYITAQKSNLGICEPTNRQPMLRRQNARL